MPAIATPEVAGYTIAIVKGSYCLIGFPTNGQAKELPIATWVRLWRDVPRTNVTVRSLPTQGRVTSVTR